MSDKTSNIVHAYDKWAEDYDLVENLTRDLDREVIITVLSDQKFASILEIGCGTGKNTAYLTTISSNVCSIDLSSEMLAKAKSRPELGEVDFRIADVSEQWPVEDNSIELVNCNLVLEHINNIDHIFAEANRCLRNEGQLLICELHPFWQYEGKRATFERDERTIEINAFVHNISDYLMAAESNGFRLNQLNEWWHEQDNGRPPRLVSFVFQLCK